MFETIMVLLVNMVCEICIACEICICDCGLCVFCCELKGAEKSVLGGYHEFLSACSEANENTCRPPAIFVGHHGRRKQSSYFRRPPRPTQIPSLFSSALGKPTKIGHFRQYRQNSCLFSSNIFSAAIFVGMPTKIACFRRFTLISWVFCPRKFRHFL